MEGRGTCSVAASTVEGLSEKATLSVSECLFEYHGVDSRAVFLLPFCLSAAAFLPSAAGPRNGRKAERQNISAAQKPFCRGRNRFLPPLIWHESFVGLGFRFKGLTKP
jgi:hypothetical protein